MNENIIVPPPLHPLLADRNRGRGRPDSNNRKKKTLIRVFIVGYFATILYFLRFKRVETFIGGGGGATFYFFFFLGGGLGGYKSLFL